MRRSWLAADFCQPVYELFLAEAVANGRVHAPGFFLDPAIRMAYCGAQWNGPAQGMVDPVREVSSAEKRIAIGVSTRQRETTEMLGGDFEWNIAQLAMEQQMMEEAGLLPSGRHGGNQDEAEKEGAEDGKKAGNEEGAGNGNAGDSKGAEGSGTGAGTGGDGSRAG